MTLLSVDGLRTSYITRGRVLNAVDGVSLDVDESETVGLGMRRYGEDRGIPLRAPCSRPCHCLTPTGRVTRSHCLGT